MPIYNYKCSKCNKEIEVLVLPHEKEPKECPFCGGELSKIYKGSVGLTFKGSGFYITDYARKDSHTSKKRNKKDDKGSKSKESKKS